MNTRTTLLLSSILVSLLIFGSVGIGNTAERGPGGIRTAPSALRHDFPDKDVEDHTQGDINVLVISNQYEDTVAADLQANTTGINFTSLNVAAYIPVPADFDGFDSVLLFENAWINDSVDVGNAIYDYQQGGGGVVLATFVWQRWSNNTAYGDPQPGFGNLESVSPLISDTQGCEYTPDDMGMILDPGHPIMNGVSSLYAPSFRGGTQLSAVGTALALWSTPNFLGTDDPLVAVYEPASGGRTAAISVYPNYAHYGGFTGDFYQLFENALNWVATQQTCDYCLTDSYEFAFWCIDVTMSDWQGLTLMGTADWGGGIDDQALVIYLDVPTPPTLALTGFDGYNYLYTFNTRFVSPTMATGLFQYLDGWTGFVDVELVDCGSASSSVQADGGGRRSRR